MTILGQKFEFNDPQLLTQALTHRSANKNNNERLEFLGDSILGFVVTRRLYCDYPDLPEGKLSRMRSSLVKGVTLAKVARHFNIQDELILGVGELKSGGFNRSSVLADAVEAIFGAVFMDQGFDVAENFILKTMDIWLQKVDPNVTDKDAKTRLQECLQKNGMKIPQYKLIERSGKDHLQTFKVECTVKEMKLHSTAKQRSLKKAEQQAAQEILNQLNQSYE